LLTTTDRKIRESATETKPPERVRMKSEGVRPLSPNGDIKEW